MRAYLGWVVAFLLALALAGSLVYRAPSAVRAEATTTTTTPGPNVDSEPNLIPPNVYTSDGGCSVSSIEDDLNQVTAALRLLGRFATQQDAETFGRAFYNCLFFTT